MFPVSCWFWLLCCCILPGQNLSVECRPWEGSSIGFLVDLHTLCGPQLRLCFWNSAERRKWQIKLFSVGNWTQAGSQVGRNTLVRTLGTRPVHSANHLLAVASFWDAIRKLYFTFPLSRFLNLCTQKPEASVLQNPHTRKTSLQVGGSGTFGFIFLLKVLYTQLQLELVTLSLEKQKNLIIRLHLQSKHNIWDSEVLFGPEHPQNQS